MKIKQNNQNNNRYKILEENKEEESNNKMINSITVEAELKKVQKRSNSNCHVEQISKEEIDKTPEHIIKVGLRSIENMEESRTNN